MSIKASIPVKLRVTFQVLKQGKTSWLQKYCTSGFYLNETEYKNAISDKPSRALRDAFDAFIEAKAKAKKIIRDFPSINADLFTLHYTGKAIRSAEVEKLFSLHIENFQSNGQIKSADSYESTKQSLSRFSPGNLILNVIDKDFLDRYEKWMLSNGFSKGKSDKIKEERV